MTTIFKNIRPALLLTLVGLLWLLGCTKQYDPGDIDGGTGGSTSKRLVKIAYDDGSYAQIQYNSANLPSKMTLVENNNAGGTDTYVYNLYYASDKLVEMTGSDGVKFRYTYTDNNITKIEILTSANVVVGYYAYTYGADNRLIRTDIHTMGISGTGPDPNPYMRYETSYYPNGNLEKMIVYYKNQQNNNLEKGSEYQLLTYDDKRNTAMVFESNPYLPLYVPLPNNPLTEKHLGAAGQQFGSATHTYTYDAQGYPLTRRSVVKEDGFPDEVTEATFTYEG